MKLNNEELDENLLELFTTPDLLQNITIYHYPYITDIHIVHIIIFIYRFILLLYYSFYTIMLSIEFLEGKT